MEALGWFLFGVFITFILQDLNILLIYFCSGNHILAPFVLSLFTNAKLGYLVVIYLLIKFLSVVIYDYMYAIVFEI